MDVPLLIPRLVLLAILLMASFFFAGCDIAFFSLSRAQLDLLKGKGRAGARVRALVADPQRLLVAIYIGNELVNVAISAIATFVAIDVFGNVWTGVALGVGVFILLVFGEIIPKTLAHYNNEKWALLAVYPLVAFMTLTYPAQVVVSWISARAMRLFGGKAGTESFMLTEAELKTMVEESAEEGIIDAGEKEMIHGVFELGDVTAEDVMTPRADIMALEVSTPVKEAWDKMAASPYARAPVYKDVIDNIVGTLFKKDLLKLSYPPAPDIQLESLAREPFITPETIKVKELLREFKKRKSHLAIVMDEFGAVQGVVTMDDVLEELVGETRNGQSAGRDEVERLGAGVFRISASMELERFNEYFDADLIHDDIRTVGGYVFHLFGRAPKWGESLEANQFCFTVEKVQRHRIIELRVKRIETQSTQNAADTAEEG